MKKNVASQSIGAQMTTVADGTAFTGAVSVLVTIDNGTQTAGAGTAPAHEGNGYHSYTPTQAETNGEHITFTFTGTGAITASVQVYTSVDANIISISDDTTAADNLELQFDGVTGLLGDTYPATQSQVNALGSATGSGIPFAVENDNVLSSIEGVSFVGVQTSGTFADLKATDNVRQVIDDTGNIIDIVQEFNVGPDRIATLIDFKGILNGGNDEIYIQAYNWTNTTWETKAIYEGKSNTSVNDTVDAVLIPLENTGTGANLGRVLTRFITLTAQSNPTLRLDSVFVYAVAQTGTLGFEGGAVWINTNTGISGTGSGVGTASNPSDNITDARTIADSQGLNTFNISDGSNLGALGQDFEGYNFQNDQSGYVVNLDGRSLSFSYFRRARIQGNDSGSNAQRVFLDSCRLDGNTLGDYFATDCAFGGDVVAAQASNTYTWDVPRAVAVGTYPTFDFNSLADVQFISTRTSVGIQLKGMVASSISEIHGEGGNILIDASCVGGQVAIFGNFTLTDSSGGAVTIVDGGRVDYAQIQSASSAAITAYDGPTNAEMEARTLPSADYFDPSTDTVANVTTVATTTTNTDMRGTDNAATAANLATVDANVDAILVDTGTTIPAQITGLNDIAATDIVSAGAITTLSGAVVNVDLVDVTTTNTDMRGTDGANTIAPDNAGITANGVAIAALNDISVSDIHTTQMTESYADDGVAPTIAQALYLIQQMIGDFSITGKTITTKKLDGATTAATHTLDTTKPTSRTRST